MKRIATAILTISLLTATMPAFLPGAEAAPGTSAAVGFGMDANSIQAQKEAGVAPDYGTFWVGPWTLKHGWGGPDNMMGSMRSQGVTPAIHFYYWGDDISQSCIEHGCWSSLHGAHKDKAGWQQLTDQTIQHLNAQMGGEPVVIFLETEFNKADVQYYEPLDGYLAEKAKQIKQGYPNAHIVLSLGSWNKGAWTTWDRAAAASDAIGIQGMRGSTRDSSSHYSDLYETTLSNAQFAKATFGKPVFLQDIALSTYPEPEYISRQATELREFFDGMDALQEAGVEAMVYRSFRNTNMDLANYYGHAERHWGLAYQDGTYKPSAQVWIDGVKAIRSGSGSGGSGGGAPAPTFSASFALTGGVNEWWVETKVTSSHAPVKVEAKHNDGNYVTLPKTSWGTYAKSFHAPAGGTMTLRATDAYGQQVTSDAMPWLKPANRAPVASFTATVVGQSVSLDGRASSDADGDVLSYAWSYGDGAYGTGAHGSHEYAPGTYTVRLTVSDGALQHTASRTIEVKAPNRAPTASLSVSLNGMSASADASASSDPDGDALATTIDFGDGTIKTGAKASHTYTKAGTYTVKATVSDGKATASTSRTVTVQSSAYEASFQVSPSSNNWWVQVDVQSPDGVKKVEARVNGGSYTELPKQSWGHYAKSFHVPTGANVEFRATAPDGRQVVSEPVTWMQKETAPAPTMKAIFTPKTQDNKWWVEVDVKADQPLSKVDVKVRNGDWQELPKTKWGSYAKSIHTGSGGDVTFRATATNGATATSDTYRWG